MKKRSKVCQEYPNNLRKRLKTQKMSITNSRKHKDCKKIKKLIKNARMCKKLGLDITKLWLIKRLGLDEKIVYSLVVSGFTKVAIGIPRVIKNLGRVISASMIKITSLQLRALSTILNPRVIFASRYLALINQIIIQLWSLNLGSKIKCK